MPEGPLYLPGLPDPVSQEEWLDPGELEVDIGSIQCQALLAEWMPMGVPEDLKTGRNGQDDFLTDARSGVVYMTKVVKGSNELSAHEEYENADGVRAAKVKELTGWHDAKP